MSLSEPHTCDYVIVGAGSAGCVLANRLSADPSTRVLLLEAGPPDRKREIAIPAAFPTLMRSVVDWNYVTAPQEALHGREIYHPRGKTLGGSSSINAQVYQRGHAADFDGWARLGNPGSPSRKAVMKKVQYLVRINKDPDSDWGASVPDLPGCVATGRTIDAALRRIGRAIELHLRGMREDGLRPPPPRQRSCVPGVRRGRWTSMPQWRLRPNMAIPEPGFASC